MQKKGLLRILVICTGNSARSQMAEGFFKYYKKDWEIYSAGTEPKVLNPLAVKAMAEKGIDISGYKSKHVGLFTGNEFDYVITVCDNAKESCPVFSGGAEYIHWSFEDPAAATGKEDKKIKSFRKIRDQIKDKILEFIE